MAFSYPMMAALLFMSSPAFYCEAVSEPFLVRALSGDELLRIGEIHDVQNHFPEALTYYEQALQSFRARKQRKG
ncbi:MAG: protein of unknown function, TPR-like, partial [Nitrospira sp.]|nr:protein of unknown function, TPR-like [Nitrospira sp.]